MNNSIVYNDRRGSLIFFGIVEILLGLFFLFLGVFSFFSGVAKYVQYSDGGSFYSFFMSIIYSAMLLSAGIGSIAAKSWARPLSLLISAGTVIAGVILFIGVLIWGDIPVSGIHAYDEQNVRAMSVLLVLMDVFLFVFLIIIPGLFFAYYNSKNVFYTLASNSRKQSRLDKIPLPVFFLASSFAAIGINYFFITIFKYDLIIMPLFGAYLRDGNAAILSLIYTAFSFYCAWGIYKLKQNAWQISFLFTVFYLLSFGYTYISKGAYVVVRFCSSIEMMFDISMEKANYLMAVMLVIGLLMLGLQLFCKKYFIVDSQNNCDEESVDEDAKVSNNN